MGNIERILTKLHINELNDMQNDAFDAILHTDNDVIILSPTGSGKTLAYLLPVSQLADAQSDNVQVLVIVPGRELALQSDTVLKNMGSGLRSCGCYGGRPAMEEHKTLKQVKPQVIFGTPGRLNDHIDKENISPYGVRYVVIDEFDKCLEMGFHDEMARLMKKLPGVRRRILLSATDAEQIPNFVRLAKAEKLDYLIEEEQVTERIRLYEVNSPSKDKLDTLNQLLRSFGDSSSIVFLNYRDSVERTADYLRRSGFSASHFHGGMEQKLREDALYKFSNGSSNIFVSTDLASRGLDIPDIDNIVHYHLPQSEDGYIHRVGRTARWESEGRAFFLLGPDEYIPEFVEGDVETFDIPDNLPQPALPKMATIYIGKGKKDKISKGDIVGYLCKKGGLEPNEIGRIDVKDRYTYAAVMRQKVSQVLKMTRGEKIKGIKTIIEIVK
ncbi:MAG: DEAD/DEAH box helicase [Prevotella sp.]|nr:DEAD/DEAH box helicase [Prevotella sp.]